MVCPLQEPDKDRDPVSDSGNLLVKAAIKSGAQGLTKRERHLVRHMYVYMRYGYVVAITC